MSKANRLRLGGAILFGVPEPVFLLFGLQIASAASVSLWLSLELMATAVLGRLFFRDHLGWLSVVGVVAAGVPSSVGQGTAGLWAGLLVALACVCWRLGNHFTALIDGIAPP